MPSCWSIRSEEFSKIWTLQILWFVKRVNTPQLLVFFKGFLGLRNVSNIIGSSVFVKNMSKAGNWHHKMASHKFLRIKNMKKILPDKQISNVQNPDMTFHCTDWFLEILNSRLVIIHISMGCIIQEMFKKGEIFLNTSQNLQLLEIGTSSTHPQSTHEMFLTKISLNAGSFHGDFSLFVP